MYFGDEVIKCLVFGNVDSGKTSFVIEHTSELLRGNPDSIALIIARKTKTERKIPEIPEDLLNRFYFKWAENRVSLIQVLCNLHVYSQKPLISLIIEDIQTYVGREQIFPIIALILNSISTFPLVHLLVTYTPMSSDTNIFNFRLLFTHFINTCRERRYAGHFHKNPQLTLEELQKAPTTSN